MDVRMYSALFSLCAGCMAIALGCADGGSSVVQRDDPFASLTTDELFQKQPASYVSDDDASSETALVSAKTHHPASAPALIQLGRGESLNAAIDRANGPVLLDFFADWCGPCRAQGRILHSVEQTAADSGTLMIKINIDEHPDLAEQLDVTSLPTLMMVKDGKVVQRRSGVTQERLLASWMR
jgi:thioredoxin 1